MITDSLGNHFGRAVVRCPACHGPMSYDATGTAFCRCRSRRLPDDAGFSWVRFLWPIIVPAVLTVYLVWR
jgi:hypothetical protein